MNSLFQKAEDLIREVLQKHQKPVVSCSYGKDSMVVLWMVKKVAEELNIKFDVLFNDTGVEFPDFYKFRKQLLNDYPELNEIKTNPVKTFWETVEQYGFPIFGRKCYQDELHKKEKIATEKCCENLKKKPTKIVIKKNQWDLMFDGLTIWESDTRLLSFKKYGLYHFVKMFNLYKCHPIYEWKTQDVWDYIEQHNVPYCEYYDKFPKEQKYGKLIIDTPNRKTIRSARNGCWTCTVGCHRDKIKLEFLHKNYPKLFKTLMDKGLKFETAISKTIPKENVDWALDYYPCQFYKL